MKTMDNPNLRYFVWVAASVALLGGPSIFVYQSALAQMPPFVSYDNPNLGVSMQYPSDWKTIEVGTRVLFLSPSDSTSDAAAAAPARVLLSVIPNVNTPVTEIANQVPYILQSSLTDFILLLSQPITINGNIAQEYVYTYHDYYLGPTEVLDIVATNGYNTYEITYSTSPSDYKSYLPIVSAMVNSLETSSGSVSSGSVSVSTDEDASDILLNTFGGQEDISPELAHALSGMLDTESQTSDQIIQNMNSPS